MGNGVRGWWWLGLWLVGVGEEGAGGLDMLAGEWRCSCLLVLGVEGCVSVGRVSCFLLLPLR